MVSSSKHYRLQDIQLSAFAALAAALAHEGIDTAYLEARGNIHGFATMRRLVPSAHRDLERLCAALRALIERGDD